MKKFLMTSAMIALAGMVSAQELSDERWGEVREFLEENPPILDQLEALMDRPSPEDQAADDATKIMENADVLFSSDAPFVGASEGEVVIVKFTDYSCGHCRTMNDRLKDMVERDDRIQVRMMEFPILGQRSQLAAQFALGVRKVGGNDAYKIAHNALFQAPAELTRPVLEDIADRAGVSLPDVLDAADDEDVVAQIQRNIGLARTMGITGTPGMIVGDVIVRGSVPTRSMTQLIDQFYPE